MSHTLYATFARPEDAEKAAGALLERGARAEDLSVIRRPGEGFSGVTEPKATASNVTIADMDDVTEIPATASATVANTETPHEISASPAAADTKSAAVQGSIIGAGLGAVIAIASLIVPGVGFVLGAGALASAIAGMVATAGMGAAAGAIVGYLKDLGVDEETAAEYGRAVESGGAVLALSVPSAGLDERTAETILNEYDAETVNRYASRNAAA